MTNDHDIETLCGTINRATLDKANLQKQLTRLRDEALELSGKLDDADKRIADSKTKLLDALKAWEGP